jgi:ABC-2 type transport system ATP-binding protein
MPPCVDVVRLCKKFGETVAVDEVTLQIPKGIVFGIYGRRCSGKSTLIRLLFGLLPVTSGSGTVLGLNILSQAPLIRARVGHLAQTTSFYESLSVQENLALHAKTRGFSASTNAQRRERLIQLCKLQGHERTLASHLPGLLRQRLAFAIALLHDPELVYLEHASPSEQGNRDCWELARELALKGRTVILTGETLDSVRLCSSVARLEGGRLEAVQA